jgi:hypothetical protein
MGSSTFCLAVSEDIKLKVWKTKPIWFNLNPESISSEVLYFIFWP